jgi:hypothetical protein
MPVSRRSIWLVSGIAGVAFTGVLIAVLANCVSDSSVVLGEKFGNVQNGTAFDRATIDIGGLQRIVIPAARSLAEPGTRGRRHAGYTLGMTIRRGTHAGQIELLLSKRLEFYGHVSGMDIRTEREKYKVWVKRTADSLVVAIDPGWDSAIEGGLSVSALVSVPVGMKVVQRPFEDEEFAGSGSRISGNYVVPSNGAFHPTQSWEEVRQQPMPTDDYRAAAASP